MDIDALRRGSAAMSAPTLLRHLLTDQFPKRCLITSSLRARSMVVLKMVADIDRGAPVVFCHASYIFPESVEYRARILRQLGLSDVRDPQANETVVLPDDQDHYEIIQTDVSGGGTIESIVHLNRSLEEFDCWISAAYHKPYSDMATERLVAEGRIVRVNPLSGWTLEQVNDFMAEHDIPPHPRIIAPTYHY